MGACSTGPHRLAHGLDKSTPTSDLMDRGTGKEVELSFRSSFITACLVSGIPLAAASGQAHDPRSGDRCFLATDWEGWRSPSPSVIYLRVRIADVYRLELSSGSWQLQDSDVHLISRIRGSEWICSPLDLDLELADDHGVVREPLIVKSIERLTPEEVNAIPAQFRP